MSSQPAAWDSDTKEVRRSVGRRRGGKQRQDEAPSALAESQTVAEEGQCTEQSPRGPRHDTQAFDELVTADSPLQFDEAAQTPVLPLPSQNGASEVSSTEGEPDVDDPTAHEMSAMGLPSTFGTTKVSRRRRSKQPLEESSEDESCLISAEYSEDVLAAMHADSDWAEYWGGWQRQVAWDFWNQPANDDSAKDETAWTKFYAESYGRYFWDYWGGRPGHEMAAPFRHTTHAALRRCYHAWGLSFADPVEVGAAHTAPASPIVPDTQIRLYPAGNPHGAGRAINFGYTVPGGESAVDTAAGDQRRSLEHDSHSAPTATRAIGMPLVLEMPAEQTAPHPKYWAQRFVKS